MKSTKAEALRVLVVDDDAHMLKTLSDVLRIRGFAASTAPNGRAGLDLAAETLPAIALVDLRLPDMDGIELVARLHELSALTEVVILTGNASLESAVQALREQSFDYLVKPVQPEVLVQTIERAGERWYRHAAEVALTESEERLRGVFEAVSDALFITDVDGRIVDANDAAERLTRLPRTHLLSLPLAKLLAIRTHADSTPVAHDSGHAPVAAGEYTLRRPGLADAVVDVRPAAVGAGGFVVTVRDLTDERRMQEQLRVAQRMEAIGRLAGGIAHDFNNLLTSIGGYSGLLLAEFPADDTRHADLVEIRRAAADAARLTRQLLAFSRHQVLQPEIIIPAEVVDSRDRMLRSILGETITLECRQDTPAGSVKVDPGAFEQVLMNLVMNARDAMPQGGRLTIETRNVDLDVENAAHDDAVPAGAYVMLSVADTGTGIPDSLKERIFEPFFTTKESGKGTGLGLATVYGTVRQSGGYISLGSREGDGTVFRVFLPRVDEDPVRLSGAGAMEDRIAPSSETILIVEDQVAVRRLAARILSRQGFRVLEAQGGPDALLLLDQLGGPIDLLVTDVVMPDMDGHTLAALVRDRLPGTRVLFVTGYAEDMVHRIVAGEEVPLLAKPYSPEGLLERVREVLDR